MRMSDIVFGYIWQSLFTNEKVAIFSLAGALLVTLSIFILIIFKQTTTSSTTSTEAISRSVVNEKILFDRKVSEKYNPLNNDEFDDLEGDDDHCFALDEDPELDNPSHGLVQMASRVMDDNSNNCINTSSASIYSGLGQIDEEEPKQIIVN